MKYLLTGTRVFGEPREDSDLDIVMMFEDATLFQDCLEKKGIVIDRTDEMDVYGEGGGYYFDLCGIKINIIIAMNEKAYTSWDFATRQMVKEDSFLDRKDRINAFREHYNWRV